MYIYFRCDKIIIWNKSIFDEHIFTLVILCKNKYMQFTQVLYRVFQFEFKNVVKVK